MRGDGLYRIPNSPFWYYKVKLNGRWRGISTKTKSYQAAKRLRRQALQDQDEGRLPEGEIARWPFERAALQYMQKAATQLRPSSLKKGTFLPSASEKILRASSLRKNHRNAYPRTTSRDEK